MINPYEAAVKISEEETERRAKLLFESFAKAYEDRESGIQRRPELGDLFPLNYMQERQTLTFILHPELKKTAYEIGYIIGTDICGDQLKGKTLPEIIAANKPVTESIKYAIEEIVEADEEHVIYRHYECADCYGIPDIHDKICVYECGVAAGMFSTALGRPVTVVETKCCANGDGCCEFLVETVK